MTLEQQLPRLLDEIANGSPVGSPPALDVVSDVAFVRPRSSRGVVIATAASVAVLLVGLIVVAGRPRDQVESDAVWTPLASMPADTWVEFPQIPLTERFQHAAVATDNGIFVWGGCCEPGTWNDADSSPFDDGAYFELAEGTWRVLPGAPLDLNRGDALATWNGTEVIVVNGVGQIRAAAFDPTTFTWRSIAAPAGDSAVGAVSRLYPLPSGRVVFVLSQYDDGLGNGVRVQIYDPETDTWAAGAEPRSQLSYGTRLPANIHGSAVSGATIGILSSAQPNCGSAAIDVYDTTTNSWRTLDDLHYPGSDWMPSAVVGIDRSRFLILGGPCDGGPQRLGLIVDPADGSATVTADVPVGIRGGFRYDMSWTGAHVVGLNGDGRLFVYRPTTDEWSVTAPIPVTNGGGAALAADGVPMVWIDDTVIVPAVAFAEVNNINSQSCCQPVQAGWAYRLG